VCYIIDVLHKWWYYIYYNYTQSKAKQCGNCGSNLLDARSSRASIMWAPLFYDVTLFIHCWLCACTGQLWPVLFPLQVMVSQSSVYCRPLSTHTELWTRLSAAYDLVSFANSIIIIIIVIIVIFGWYCWFLFVSQIQQIYRVAQNKPDYSNCQIVRFILRHPVFMLWKLQLLLVTLWHQTLTGC